MKPETTRISENRCSQCGAQITEECDEQGVIHGQCPAWNGSNGHTAYTRGQTEEEMQHCEVAHPTTEARKALMAMARARYGDTIAYIDVETGEIGATTYPTQRGEWIEHEPSNTYEIGVPRDVFFSYKALDEIITVAVQMAQEQIDMMQ